MHAILEAMEAALSDVKLRDSKSVAQARLPGTPAEALPVPNVATAVPELEPPVPVVREDDVAPPVQPAEFIAAMQPHVGSTAPQSSAFSSRASVTASQPASQPQTVGGPTAPPTPAGRFAD